MLMGVNLISWQQRRDEPFGSFETLPAAAERVFSRFENEVGTRKELNKE